MDIPKTIVPWSLRDRGKLISFDNFFPRSSQHDTGEQAQRDPVTCLNLILRDAIIIVSNLSLCLHERSALPFVLRSLCVKLGNKFQLRIGEFFLQCRKAWAPNAFITDRFGVTFGTDHGNW